MPSIAFLFCTIGLQGVPKGFSSGSKGPMMSSKSSVKTFQA
jgi:hypothetical protein